MLSNEFVSSDFNDRFYRIGGITIGVKADLPVTELTFSAKIRKFQVFDAGQDVVRLRHHFSMPEMSGGWDGKLIHGRGPWKILQQEDAWMYQYGDPKDGRRYRLAFFQDHFSVGEIYGSGEAAFKRGNLETLTRFPSDQFLLSNLLSFRQGCIVHASGVEMDGQGFLFVGHSGAGKSTIAGLLRGRASVLSDDRLILRRFANEWRIFGTWYNWKISATSPDSAPLKAIFILEQSQVNQLIPLDRKEIIHQLLGLLIKGTPTKDWWMRALDLIQLVSLEVPVYRLRFAKSRQVIQVLETLL